MWPDPSRGRFRLYALVLATGAVSAFCLLILEEGGLKLNDMHWWLSFVPLWLPHLPHLKGDNSTTCDPWTSQNFTELMGDYMVNQISLEFLFENPMKQLIILSQARIKSVHLSPGVSWVWCGEMSSRMWGNYIFLCTLLCATEVGKMLEYIFSKTGDFSTM